MQVDDIKGSHPRGRSTKPTRPSLVLDDIEGTCSRNRTFNRKATFNAIDYRDVTRKHWET